MMVSLDLLFGALSALSIDELPQDP